MSLDLDSKTEELRADVRLELDAQYSRELSDLRQRLESMGQQRLMVEVMTTAVPARIRCLCPGLDMQGLPSCRAYDVSAGRPCSRSQRLMLGVPARHGLCSRWLMLHNVS